MKRALVVFLFLLVATAFVLAGGQTEKSSAGGSAMNGETISFWFFGGPDQTTTDFLNDMKTKFKSSTGITVDWKIVSWDDAQRQLLLAVTSKNAPDISMVGATWVGQFLATGAILELTPYLPRMGGAEAFVPGAWQSAGVKGNIIAPPWDGDTRALVYRKDTFDQLGLKPPRTWDELIQVAQTIQQKTGQKYPFAIDGKGGNQVYNLVLLTYLDGGNVVSPDGKTATLTSPSVVKAATFLTDLITKYKVMSPSVASKQADEIAQDFMNGQTSMIIPPTALVYYQAAQQKSGWDFGKKWDLALPPTSSPDIKQVSAVLPDNLMIFKSTKHRDAALKFMAFLLDQPQEVKYTTTFGIPPTTVAAFNDPAYNSPYWKTLYEMMKVGTFTPLVPGWGEAETSIAAALSNIMSAAMSGDVPQETIVAELAKANKQFQEGIDRGK